MPSDPSISDHAATAPARGLRADLWVPVSKTGTEPRRRLNQVGVPARKVWEGVPQFLPRKTTGLPGRWVITQHENCYSQEVLTQ
jgi:hypothetical protein